MPRSRSDGKLPGRQGLKREIRFDAQLIGGRGVMDRCRIGLEERGPRDR